MPLIILKVDPLGDAVMATAIARELQNRGLEVTILTKGLWEPILRPAGVPICTEGHRFSGHAVVVDVCQYLLQPGSCHRAEIPEVYRVTEHLNRGKFGHLVNWMGMHVDKTLALAGIRLTHPLNISSASVRLPVSEAQMENARDWIQTNFLQARDLDSKPLVLLCSAAGSPNRNIPPNVLAGAVARLREQACFALLQPLPKDVPGYNEIPCEILPMIPQELLVPILLLAKAFVGADTGPTHVAAAVRQDFANEGRVLRKVHGSEVVWMCGSSHPMALIYPNNLHVQVPRNVCPIAPCGHHGYTPVPDNEGEFSVTKIEKTGSITGCIMPSYGDPPHIAPCMANLEVDETVRIIRYAIK